jgi:hypothetical protein
VTKPGPVRKLGGFPPTAVASIAEDERRAAETSLTARQIRVAELIARPSFALHHDMHGVGWRAYKAWTRAERMRALRKLIKSHEADIAQLTDELGELRAELAEASKKSA